MTSKLNKKTEFFSRDPAFLKTLPKDEDRAKHLAAMETYDADMKLVNPSLQQCFDAGLAKISAAADKPATMLSTEVARTAGVPAQDKPVGATSHIER